MFPTQDMRAEDASLFPDYCCPLCKGPVTASPGAYRCAPCAKEYPVLLGIPDFRVWEDPYLGFDDDRQRARMMSERFPDTDFTGLLEYYWSISDSDRKLARRYLRYALTAVERSRRFLDSIVDDMSGLTDDPRMVIELGCGTGGFLVAAAGRFDRVIGVDIALRHLIVAKKRLDERRVRAELVCCCAEHLPFHGASFDVAVASDVIEHSKNQRKFFTETHRVLLSGGLFFAVTQNRFSLAPEPHVRVWGVGFLPRRWMKPYVRMVRGVAYDHIRLLSFFELRRMLLRSRFGGCRISLPTFSGPELSGLPVWERTLALLYNRIKNLPVARTLLLVFGPALRLFCVKRD